MNRLMDRLTCVFSGRVQGVGFRYTVHNLAMQYNVQGYVRNLPDGNVEVVMEGPESDMTNLLDDIKQKMDGYIRDLKVGRSPASGEFQRFFIKH